MKKYKKIILALYIPIIFVSIYCFGLVQKTQASILMSSQYDYTSRDGVFYVNIDNGKEIGSIKPFSGWFDSSSNTLRLPHTISSSHTIDGTNLNLWENVSTIYSQIASIAEKNASSNEPDMDHSGAMTDFTDANNAEATINAAVTLYVNSLPDLATPDIGAPATFTNNSIKINPAAVVQGKSASITGYYDNHAFAKKTCYLYIGGNNGKLYYKGEKSADSATGECLFTWATSADTTLGHHAAYISFQDSRPADTNNSILASALENYVQDVINVCAKDDSACRNISNSGYGGTLVANNKVLTIGKSSSPLFKLFIGNSEKAQSYAGTGKICHFYIGDGKGGWIPKGQSPVTTASPNCSYSWDFSGTAPGGHGFIVNIFDRDITNPGGEQSLSPNVAKVTVCAKGTTDCKDNGQPFNPDPDGVVPDPGEGANGDAGGGGGGSSGGGSTIGSFDGSVSGSDFMNWLAAGLAGKDGKITLESVFNFYVLTNIIGLVAFIAIIVGGVMLLTAGGDPAKATKGKKTLSYAALALIFGALSYGIVTYVVNLVNTR